MYIKRPEPTDMALYIEILIIIVIIIIIITIIVKGLNPGVISKG